MQRHRKKIIDVASAIVLLALLALDVAVWKDVVTSARIAAGVPSLYFLPVAQGESALLVLPGGVTVLTDAGSDAGIVDQLEKVLPSGGPSYIDLAIISYPEAADYGGYQYILGQYTVGAFLYDGRSDDAHSAGWTRLVDAITAKHIPLITVGAGDRIHYGATGEIDILSPDAVFAHSVDPKEAGIVQKVITPKFSALLTTDIDTNVEDVLLSGNLRAEILKAPFPGLSSSSADTFLRAVAPRIIVVAPGVKNTPSAPTKAMLARIASSTDAEVVSPRDGAFLLYNK
jgi:beta-lactamase superfamily II metal-dependent hydrolase